ncbi:MAG TPA: hypothetical protein V6C78_04045, partial [Crinalium sp.]
YWQPTNWLRVAAYILKSWLLMFGPLLLIQGVSLSSITHAGYGLGGIGGAAIAYYVTQPALRQRSIDTLNWVCRAVYTTLGSLLLL